MQWFTRPAPQEPAAPPPPPPLRPAPQAAGGLRQSGAAKGGRDGGPPSRQQQQQRQQRKALKATSAATVAVVEPAAATAGQAMATQDAEPTPAVDATAVTTAEKKAQAESVPADADGIAYLATPPELPHAAAPEQAPSAAEPAFNPLPQTLMDMLFPLEVVAQPGDNVPKPADAPPLQPPPVQEPPYAPPPAPPLAPPPAPPPAVQLPLPPPAPDVRECCVCLGDTLRGDLLLLIPCAHRCVCQACADALLAAAPERRRCPKCRGLITLALRVFED